jgi:hypothetical protein
MRIFAVLLVTSWIAVAAPGDQKARGGLELPRGAKQIEANAWVYTDAQGKTWTYRRTPFGLVRLPGKPENPTEQKAAPRDVATPFGQVKTTATSGEVIDNGDNVIAVEEGDSIRFERPSPFGKYRWVRKKTELTEMEKRVWERESRNQAAKPAGKE